MYLLIHVIEGDVYIEKYLTYEAAYEDMKKDLASELDKSIEYINQVIEKHDGIASNYDEDFGIKETYAWLDFYESWRIYNLDEINLK